MGCRPVEGGGNEVQGLGRGLGGGGDEVQGLGEEEMGCSAGSGEEKRCRPWGPAHSGISGVL
jgi:hypothetical protein